MSEPHWKRKLRTAKGARSPRLRAPAGRPSTSGPVSNTAASAGGRTCPSGAHRRRGPPAGPRGSPTRRATGPCACPRRRTRRPPRSGSRSWWRGRLPRGSRSTSSSASMPSCSGCRNPIARRTRSAGSSKSPPSTLTIRGGAPGPSRSHSMREQARARTLPFRPWIAPVVTLKSRSAPSALRARGTEVKRPVRPGQELLLPVGRTRQDLELGHRERALPEGGADAVRARVAAPDHHDVLVLGGDRDFLGDRVARHPPVLLRQEVHREVHSLQIAPLDRQITRLLRAPREDHRVELVHERPHREVDPHVHARPERDPSASICRIRRSMRSFSILKSGIP